MTCELYNHIARIVAGNETAEYVEGNDSYEICENSTGYVVVLNPDLYETRIDQINADLDREIQEPGIAWIFATFDPEDI